MFLRLRTPAMLCPFTSPRPHSADSSAAASSPAHGVGTGQCQVRPLIPPPATRPGARSGLHRLGSGRGEAGSAEVRSPSPGNANGPSDGGSNEGTANGRTPRLRPCHLARLHGGRFDVQIVHRINPDFVSRMRERQLRLTANGPSPFFPNALTSWRAGSVNSPREQSAIARFPRGVHTPPLAKLRLVTVPRPVLPPAPERRRLVRPPRSTGTGRPFARPAVAGFGGRHFQAADRLALEGKRLICRWLECTHCVPNRGMPLLRSAKEGPKLAASRSLGLKATPQPPRVRASRRRPPISRRGPLFHGEAPPFGLCRKTVAPPRQSERKRRFSWAPAFSTYFPAARRPTNRHPGPSGNGSLRRRPGR